MSLSISMPAQFPPVHMLEPAADAGGRTSQYVTLSKALKAWIVCYINQGNAAQVTLSPLQAKDVSGTSSKAIGATCNIWSDEDEVTSDALVKQAAAATYQTAVTTKKKVVVFEIDPARDLDVANGFYTIAIETSASNAANITAALIFEYGRYQQATPPTLLTN